KQERAAGCVRVVELAVDTGRETGGISALLTDGAADVVLAAQGGWEQHLNTACAGAYDGQARTVRTDDSGHLLGARVVNLFDKILRAGEGRELRRLETIARQVREAGDVFADLSDEELREESEHFKERLEDGESLDDILVEAFAAVREAAERTLGQRPY